MADISAMGPKELTLFLCFSPGQKQQTRNIYLIYCELVVYELILAIKRKSALAMNQRFAHFVNRFMSASFVLQCYRSPQSTLILLAFVPRMDFPFFKF